MKRIHTLIAATGLGLCLSGNAFAVVVPNPVNGSFNEGLTGWDALGDVAVSNGVARLTTAALLEVDDTPASAGAFNVSGITAAPVAVPGGVEEFAGLTIGALDNPGSNQYAYEGSVLKQTFNVANAGDTLTFDWSFLSNEGGKPDFAFAHLAGVLSTLVVNDSVSAPNNLLSLQSSGTFSHSFSIAGAYTLAVGVVDVDDYSVTSELRIDNVVLTAVPEPETYAMLLAGLGLLGYRARRRNASRH